MGVRIRSEKKGLAMVRRKKASRKEEREIGPTRRAAVPTARMHIWLSPYHIISSHLDEMNNLAWLNLIEVA